MSNATFESGGTLEGFNLFAGDFPRVEVKLTIAAGAGELDPGAVLALDANGEGVLVDSADAEPSVQTPFAILAHAVDASVVSAEAIVYLSGEFNELALTFGGADTADDHRAKLRKLGIMLDKNVGA